tara:strand:+ start:171 stop:476 length:306 start_codon:yes stop_codon:yes gene_type:complete
MAKLSSIQKNLNRQELVKKFKNKRTKLKSKIMQKDITMEERIKLQNKLNDLPRNSSHIRVRNRCKLTGRTRGVYRKFGLSRIKLRELTMLGSLPGVVKSSW